MAEDKRIANGRIKPLDDADLQIVRLLQTNGRLTQERIGREISLSRPAVHERIKRLEESNIILGYRARIDWSKTEQSLTIFIWVRTSGGKLHDLADAIMQLSTPETLVEECHLVTGEWCLLLKARTKSTATLQCLINNLREMPRVRNTMTTLVMSSAAEPGFEGQK